MAAAMAGYFRVQSSPVTIARGRLGAEVTALPAWIKWLHEIKIDGYRCMRGWTEARSGSGTQLAEAAKASGVDALEL